MTSDTCLTNFARHDWLADGPLNEFIDTYIEALRQQRYPDHTIRAYLGCLAHFSHWIKCAEIEISSLDAPLIKRFLRRHLPVCACPAPCYPSVASSGAALRHLLRLLPGDQTAASSMDPVAVELERFGEYLSNTSGLAPITRERRIHHVGTFLVREFGASTPLIAQLSAARLDTFFAELSSHLQPASLRVVGNSLRSYFRYRTLLGESTSALAAALPRIADWRRTTLPKVLSDVELEAFLKAFDCTDPVGLRDYAIARCLRSGPARP
jgi:integrase/recombinase XerD